MKPTPLIKAALAGLLSATLFGNLNAEEPAAADRPEPGQIREQRRDGPPARREAAREFFRHATPEQRNAMRERFRDMPPERRQALRERFRTASPAERSAMMRRLQQPLPPSRDEARQAPGASANQDEFRPRLGAGGPPPRGERGATVSRPPQPPERRHVAGRPEGDSSSQGELRPGRGPGGPPAPEEREKLIQERRERGKTRLAELRKELAEGSLSPDEQRQLARLEQWEKDLGRGNGQDSKRGPGGPGERGTGPRGGKAAPNRGE